MRNSEICNLKVKDLDLGANRVTIFAGKNHKYRIINISAECTNALIEYLGKVKLNRDDCLFSTILKKNKLHPSDLRKILRTVAKRQLGSRRVYPHLIRHALATNLLNSGACLITIKDQLGHAFIVSTMVYVNSTAFRNRAEYEYFKTAYM
jgi:integrase/recombinase XerC